MSIKKIQQLRNITSLGIMECKEALLEAKGDIDLAVENLYSKGTIKYVKKNAQKLGFVNASLSKNMKSAVIIEFNTQTDFVSKNQQFLDFVKKVTELALEKKTQDIKQLLKYSFENKSVEQHQSILVNQFKENIHISRLKYVEIKNGILGSYVHNNKIAVVVSINKEIPELAHDLAIHITAMRPEYLDKTSIKEERITKEKNILKQQIKEKHPNKKDDILEKIIEGKLQKFYQEIVLLEQIYVKDKNISIKNLLSESSCNIVDMYRFEVSKD